MPSRQELEQYWWKRVEEAKHQLQLARQHTREVENDLQSMPSVDGRFAHRQAIRLENQALRKYGSTLRVFIDLLLGGKIPEEPSS